MPIQIPEFLNNIHNYSRRNSNWASTATNKVLCIRKNYKETKPSGLTSPDISWLVDGKTLETMIWNVGTIIDASCDTYTYHTDDNHIITKSHAQKVKLGDLFCCGCRFPNDDPCPFFKPMYSDMRNLKEGETPFCELMKIFEEIYHRDTIGRLIFKIHSSVDEENGAGYLKNMVWNPLERAKFNVPLLQLKSSGRIELTPFLELISFERLIMIGEEPLMLNNKILKCDFLFLDIPLLNIELLSTFEGFALLLGKREKNNLSLDFICEKIESYMEDAQSTIEFAALYDNEKWVTDEMIERLKAYSIQNDEDFPKPKSAVTETIFRLDKEDNAAILIRSNKNVVFVRNGWRKWQQLLETLDLGF